MNELQTSNTLRRLEGREIQIEAEFDGIQRREFLSFAGEQIGRLYTSRHDRRVTAYRTNCGQHEERAFEVRDYDTKPKALTAARRWIAGAMA